MYDGGNNILVEDTEHRTVSVRSSGFPSLTISGLTEVTDVSGTGEWLFPRLQSDSNVKLSTLMA